MKIVKTGLIWMRIDFMSLEIKHKPKHGMWFQDGLNFYWKEFTDNFGKSYKLYKPTEIENVSREATFDILFIQTYNDNTAFNRRAKAFFKQVCTMRIREDATENIILKFNDNKKYYLMDISSLGKCMAAPLESTDILTVEFSEPIKISQQEATEIMKNSGYCFGSVELDASGKIKGYVTTV